MRYNFDWDPAKAESNVKKHEVAFERAATVFRDPNALSIFDDEHSEDEDRWLTLGLDSGGALLVVHHAYECGQRDVLGPNHLGTQGDKDRVEAVR